MDANTRPCPRRVPISEGSAIDRAYEGMVVYSFLFLLSMFAFYDGECYG